MQNPARVRDLSDPEILQASRGAIIEVLETMFFELPVAELTLVDVPLPVPNVVRAGFHGSLAGVMYVALACETCARLTRAFLGKEPDEVAPGEQCNTAFELANMLCGTTLSRLEPQGRLAIEPPRHTDETETPSGPWLRFPLEDGSIDVALHFGEGL